MDYDDEMRQRIRGEVRVQRQLTKDMRIIDLQVHGGTARGMRLDVFLHLCCPSLSRSLFQHWFRCGHICRNGSPVGAASRVQLGDHIRLEAPLPANPLETSGTGAGLTILHEEEDFLVVDKPPGQLVHQAGRVFHGTLLGEVQDYLAERGKDPQDARLVNRIDRETSGLVLIGLSADTQRRLSKALERRDVEKTYLALCHGRPAAAHGHWRDPIGPGLDDTPKRMVRADGQACHTEYWLEEGRGVISLLRITLHTGRQHQIRIHAAHNGHPLVGDWLYGSPCVGLPGQALHAHRLRFAHPHGRGQVAVESPLPPALALLWEAAAHGQDPQPRSLSAVELTRIKDPAEGQRQRRLPPWLSACERERVRAEMALGQQQMDGRSGGEDEHQGIE